ncbi:MAG: hypothetical protein WBA97_13900 [Actinophytocola sp.]|uniref:hypothetical protein n=1 Tax=Actinophytocola sp. TaxID=1872138 RepID=UPI003C720597
MIDVTDRVSATTYSHDAGFVDACSTSPGPRVRNDTRMDQRPPRPPSWSSWHPNITGHTSGYTPLIANAMGAAMTRV